MMTQGEMEVDPGRKETVADGRGTLTFIFYSHSFLLVPLAAKGEEEKKVSHLKSCFSVRI